MGADAPSPLAAALGAAVILLHLAVVWDTRRSGSGGDDAPHRELLEALGSGGGLDMLAEHKHVQQRLAQLEGTVARQGVVVAEAGAAAIESRKSAQVLQSTVDGLGVRLLTVEGALAEQEDDEDGAGRRMQGANPSKTNICEPSVGCVRDPRSRRWFKPCRMPV